MTRHQLFEKLRQGEKIPRTLFTPILMHFAARYTGRTYGEFASDYRVLADANLRILEDFDVDMLWLISDPYRETAAFGAQIEYQAEGVPKCLDLVIRDLDDIDKLRLPDVYSSQRTLDRIRGAEALAGATQGTIPIIGWIEGPLAEACDLAGVSEMLMMLMMEPDASNMLMDKCLEMAKVFAKAQIDAGCGIIGMGDAVCSQIDAFTYDTYVMERHKEIISFIHQAGGLVKLHICGNITHLLPSLREINADIVDLDWQVDIDHAFDVLGDGPVLCGNINPVSIQNITSSELYDLSKDLVEKHRNRKFILSGGCEISVNTPHENLHAMRKATRGN